MTRYNDFFVDFLTNLADINLGVDCNSSVLQKVTSQNVALAGQKINFDFRNSQRPNVITTELIIASMTPKMQNI